MPGLGKRAGGGRRGGLGGGRPRPGSRPARPRILRPPRFRRPRLGGGGGGGCFTLALGVAVIGMLLYVL